MPLKFIPTNVKYNDSGEFKNISIPADRAYMGEVITVSSTQPTNSDNKLWINTNEQTKQTYQIPTMTDMANYRTAAAQDVIDAAQDAEIVARAKADEVGIVITGKRPSMAVTAGQYVIVRNSTISGITDGLYTANSALSPSTDVTAANLTAVSVGGLNDLKAKQPRLANTVGSSTTIQPKTTQTIRLSAVSVAGYKASGVMGVVGTGTCLLSTLLIDYINQEVVCGLYNPTDTASTFTPIFVCLYLVE